MASKTISLEKGAYELLRGEKREGESFSDVIRRTIGRREPSLHDLFGILSPETQRGVAEVMTKIREEDVRAEKRALSRLEGGDGRHPRHRLPD